MKNYKVSITKVFTFDSAHHLNDYEGKCKNLHGHTYKLEVTIKGFPAENGLVMDFNILGDVVKLEIVSKLDHYYLNDVFDFNPTCELMGIWIWKQLEKKINKCGCVLEKIVLHETPTSFIAIDKEDMLDES